MRNFLQQKLIKNSNTNYEILSNKKKLLLNLSLSIQIQSNKKKYTIPVIIFFFAKVNHLQIYSIVINLQYGLFYRLIRNLTLYLQLQSWQSLTKREQNRRILRVYVGVSPNLVQVSPLSSGDLLKQALKLDQAHPVRYHQPGRYTHQQLYLKPAKHATQPEQQVTVYVQYSYQ